MVAQCWSIMYNSDLLVQCEFLEMKPMCPSIEIVLQLKIYINYINLIEEIMVRVNY